MFSHEKESAFYLDLISGNTAEKIKLACDQIDTQGHIDFLSVGPGGCQSELLFVKACREKNVELAVTVVDLSDRIVEEARSHGFRAFKTCASRMPLPDHSIDIIQFSAVGHEISSYGVKNSLRPSTPIYGVKALEIVFAELFRILRPEGVICYRDVLHPSSAEVLALRTYVGSGIISFIEWLLPSIIKSPCYIDLYPDSNVVKSKLSDSTLKLNAPIGLHRELQRHYLCFVSMLKGKKLIDQIKVLREDLDTIIPDLLHSEIPPFVHSWKEREGQEIYGYQTVHDLGRRVYDYTRELVSPAYQLRVETAYWRLDNNYNRLLGNCVDSPELEGKQFCMFRKVRSI